MDYRPDMAAEGPSILANAAFVIPDRAGNYINSFSALATAWTTALNNACLGAKMVRTSAGVDRMFFGSAAKIEEFSSGGTVTDRSLAAYTATRWWFEQFGSETIAASGRTSSHVLQTSTTGNFANLSGAPKANIVLVQKGHLLAANYDDGASAPSGVKWTSQNSSTTWTAASGNSAGSATLRESPGEIIAGTTIHDIAVLWKKTSMYVGKRVGGAEIWQFNLLSPTIGCVGQEAHVSTPLGVIFVSDNGVYLFDGSVPRPIDDGIRLSFYRSIGTAANVAMSHDEASACVYIWTRNSNCYCYNYLSDKWSIAYQSTVLGGTTFTTFVAAVRSATYEGFIGCGGATNTSRRAHIVISSEKKLCNLNSNGAGTGINATLTILQFRDPNAGKRQLTHLKRVQPIWSFDAEQGAYSEPTAATLTVTPRTRVSGGASTGIPSSLDAAKGFDINVAANSMRLDITTTAQAFGVADLEFLTAPAGSK